MTMTNIPLYVKYILSFYQNIFVRIACHCLYRYRSRSGSRYNPWIQIQSNTQNSPKIHTPSEYPRFYDTNITHFLKENELFASKCIYLYTQYLYWCICQEEVVVTRGSFAVNHQARVSRHRSAVTGRWTARTEVTNSAVLTTNSGPGVSFL